MNQDESYNNRKKEGSNLESFDFTKETMDSTSFKENFSFENVLDLPFENLFDMNLQEGKEEEITLEDLEEVFRQEMSFKQNKLDSFRRSAKESSDLDNSILLLTQETKTLEEEYKNSELELSERIERSNQQDLEIAELEERIQKTEETNEKLTLEIEERQKNISNMDFQNKEKKEKILKEIVQVLELNKELQKEGDSLDEEDEKVKKENLELKAQIEKTCNSIEEFKIHNKVLQEEISKLTTVGAELDETFKNLEFETNRNEYHLEKMEKKIQFEDFDFEIDHFTKKLKRDEEYLKDIKERIVIRVQHNADFDSNREKLELKLKSIEKKISEIDKVLESEEPIDLGEFESDPKYLVKFFILFTIISFFLSIFYKFLK
jgi:chromosome segregation ATPase